MTRLFTRACVLLAILIVYLLAPYIPGRASHYRACLVAILCTYFLVPTADPRKDRGDVFATNKALGRGMNLGNALEAPNEGEWGLTLEPGYFKIRLSAILGGIRLWPCQSGPTPGVGSF